MVPAPRAGTGFGQLRGVTGSLVTGLFCCRISKGLSEKVFAKSEEQAAAEEVVEDTGKGK